MPGLEWTYQDFVKFLKDSPEPPKDLNPLIEQLLEANPGSYVFLWGSHTVLLWMSKGILAKVALKKGDEILRREQEMLERVKPSRCPYIVQHIFGGPDVVFIEHAEGGNLHDRLGCFENPPVVVSWMLQLAKAAACFEALGYAHGDLNPWNALVDADENLRVISLGQAVRVGAGLNAGYDPYIQTTRDFGRGGLFGVAGPKTEQFALGSIYWYMTRGREVYFKLSAAHGARLLRNGVFPPTKPMDPIDRVIRNCWEGKYKSLADLVAEIDTIPAVDMQFPDPMPLDEALYKEKLCRGYYYNAKQWAMKKRI
jgi:serine/threonine protein kinase